MSQLAGTIGPVSALAAGAISFLSPCVFPLVPSYLGVLGGGQFPWRRATGFILGFGLVFIALGASASTLGQILLRERAVLEAASGVLIVLFGIFMLGLFRPWGLLRERRFDLAKASRYGPVALGAAFGFGWSPCIGPVLGTILLQAASSQSLAWGIYLLSLYTLGLAVPFLAAGLLWQKLQLERVRTLSLWVERLGGALLIALGFLVLTGQLTQLSQLALQSMPAWMQRSL